MGSLGAMKDGSPDRYFQEQGAKLVPEGIEGRVPYRGYLSENIHQLLGGLRWHGLCGCRKFESVTRTINIPTYHEFGHDGKPPHDVSITKEAPNYMAMGT